MTERARRIIALTAAFSLVAALLGATGCARSPRPVPAPAPAIPRGVIVFDMGHGEIFGADDTSQLGQSQAIARMRSAGYEVMVNYDEITAEDLRGTSGLIIAGPMQPLKDTEYDTITAFVETGGTVLLTIHVPYPVMKVPAHWGMPVGTDILMSQTPAAGPQEPSVFFADVMADDPLTQGVTKVLVVSGWPVVPVTADGTLLVSSRANTWLSPAGDQQPVPPAGSQVASFGVVGVTRLGAGRVVVSGDDAIFANLALAEGDNARLLDNIVGLMSTVDEI